MSSKRSGVVLVLFVLLVSGCAPASQPVTGEDICASLSAETTEQYAPLADPSPYDVPQGCSWYTQALGEVHISIEVRTYQRGLFGRESVDWFRDGKELAATPVRSISGFGEEAYARSSYSAEKNTRSEEIVLLSGDRVISIDYGGGTYTDDGTQEALGQEQVRAGSEAITREFLGNIDKDDRPGSAVAPARSGRTEMEPAEVCKLLTAATIEKYAPARVEGWPATKLSMQMTGPPPYCFTYGTARYRIKVRVWTLDAPAHRLKNARTALVQSLKRAFVDGEEVPATTPRPLPGFGEHAFIYTRITDSSTDAPDYQESYAIATTADRVVSVEYAAQSRPSNLRFPPIETMETAAKAMARECLDGLSRIG